MGRIVNLRQPTPYDAEELAVLSRTNVAVGLHVQPTDRFHKIPVLHNEELASGEEAGDGSCVSE